MKKLIAIIVFVLSFNCQLKAQTSDLYKVYLKSGLIIKAELVKVIPDSVIQIRQYGLVSNLKLKDVDSVVFDQAKFPTMSHDIRKDRSKRKQLLDSGWNFGFQPGFTIGSVGWDVTSSFTFRGSILRNNLKHLMYGVNVGIDPYLYYETVIGNICAEGRYVFKEKTSRSPMLYAMTGYGLNLNSPALLNDGGVCSALGFGYSFRTRNDVVFSIMMGYKYQKFNGESFFWPTGNLKTENNINRYEFKVEWRF